MTTSDNEWHRLVQRVKTNDNELQRAVRVMSGTSDSEWLRLVQQVTKSDSD